MRRKRILAFLSTAALICCLTGCQGDMGATAVDTEQVTEQSASVTANVGKSTTAVLVDNEQETVLPPNMTMDDLLNMVQINGKTLTMPTTLNEIMALGDEFSCEMAFREFVKSPEDSMENMGGAFYDIYYNDDRVFQIVVEKAYYTGDVFTTPIKRFSNGFSSDIENTDMQFSLSNGLDLNSTDQEVKELFGEPNNSSVHSPYSLMYSFHDSGITYNIRFAYNGENHEIDSDDLMAIQINME